MRVSDIAAWASCETYALQSPPRPAGRANVAAWVGTMAHGILSGMNPECPERLAFDALTPTAQHSVIQATHIAKKARELLAAQGWGVLEAEQEVRRDELTGHLDIRAYHSQHGEAIIDLKTGQGVGAAWLQVGGYISLAGSPMVPCGGVLHVPRVAIHKDVKGTLEIRDSDGLDLAWWASLKRIEEVQGGSSPTYSPGIHCGRCGIQDCPVRI